MQNKNKKFNIGEINKALDKCPDLIKRYVKDLKKKLNAQKKLTVDYLQKYRKEKYGRKG